MREDVDGSEHRFYLSRWHKDARSWGEILGPGTPFSTIGPLPAGRDDFPVHVGDLYPAMLNTCYVATFTVMVRRDAGAALRFAEDLPLYEDWECFARLARAGRGAYLACETAWNHGHAGPRLIGADALTAASTCIAMLSRIWGADAPFLATSGEQYRRVLARQHLLRARALIQAGRTSEPGAYAQAIALAGEAIARSEVSVDVVDVGGGFPVGYPDMKPPPLDDYIHITAFGYISVGLINRGNIAIHNQDTAPGCQ